MTSSCRFDSIEEAHQFVRLLAEVVGETAHVIEGEATSALNERAERRHQGLQIVGYKLQQLRQHLDMSSRLLNDLRMLRRALQRDQEPGASAGSHDVSPVQHRHAS